MFLILFTAHDHDLGFPLPEPRLAGRWRVVVDTARGADETAHAHYGRGDRYPLRARSLALLQDA
jgi:hypothetical protein